MSLLCWLKIERKLHLMQKDITEIVKAVLEPLSPFTDALCGETHTTLYLVLPLLWKIFECLGQKQSDSALAKEMKEKISEYLRIAMIMRSCSFF